MYLIKINRVHGSFNAGKKYKKFEQEKEEDEEEEEEVGLYVVIFP